MELTFKKELYPKIVLLKSAFSFTDRAYVHLDCDEKNYMVIIEKKNDCEIDEREFINEMLVQATRYQVTQDTKHIRELIYARAMASTIIEEDTTETVDKTDNAEFDMTIILKDWFDDNDKA